VLDFCLRFFILRVVKKKEILIAPSILSGDFGKLADEAKRIEDSGADAVHVDIMDGHFVPNLTLGPKACAAINRSTDLFLDVHLMMYNPYDYVERFVEAGADRITFHVEVTEEVGETLEYIRKCNVKGGLAICPETTAEVLPEFLNKCDLVLLMTVHPGFGGQAFMPEVLEKIRYTKDAIDKCGLDVHIEVDGGIDDKTAKQCVDAGANVLVSGTYLFGDDDMKSKVSLLRELGS